MAQPHELIVALAPMRSNINVSRIVRAAGCWGIAEVIATGHVKLESKIARDGADHVQLTVHRSLAPVLIRRKQDGYTLVGLEQTSNSQCIFDYSFSRKTVLVVGNERKGISAEVLQLLDAVVEIPIHGLPASHNAATSACMAMYEYCRQFRE